MLAKGLYAGGTRLLSVPLTILSLLSYLLPRRGVPLSTKALDAPLGYLDPLRGLFSIQILIQHANNEFWWWIPDICQDLPWTHVFFKGGKLALKGFFWMSGYVVTMKLVKLAKQEQWEPFLDAASSTLFRRYLRLFLPLLPVTFITLVSVKLGITTIPSHHDLGMDLSKEYLILGWLKDTMNFMNPFANIVGWASNEIGSYIIKPTWSLCAEFRASVTVMAFLVATCKVPMKKRMNLILALMLPFLYWQSTFTVMAFMGLYCTHLRHSKPNNSAARTAPPTPALTDKLPTVKVEPMSLDTEKGAIPARRKLPSIMTVGLVATFIYSFVLLRDSRIKEGKVWPFKQILPFVPEGYRVWWIEQIEATFGALMFLLPIDQVPMLQKLFRHSAGQYIGELSFGIYACHMPIIHTIWDEGYVKFVTNKYGPEAVNNFWIMSFGFVMLTVVVLWAAEAFRRMDSHIATFVAWTKTAMFRDKR